MIIEQPYTRVTLDKRELYLAVTEYIRRQLGEETEVHKFLPHFEYPLQHRAGRDSDAAITVEVEIPEKS